jgi:hypothetical protein
MEIEIKQVMHYELQIADLKTRIDKIEKDENSKQGVVDDIKTEQNKLSAEELLNREIKFYDDVIEVLEKSSKANKIELISHCRKRIEDINREYQIKTLEKQIKMVECSSMKNKGAIIISIGRAIKLMAENKKIGITNTMDSPIIETPRKRQRLPPMDSPGMEQSPMEIPLMARWPGKRPLGSTMDIPSSKSSTSDDVYSDDEKPNAK